MAKSLNFAPLVTLAIAATLFGHTTATSYIVGGELKWTYPPNAKAYATWASSYTFKVGDILVFDFTTGQHNVVQTATKASFDACTFDNTISFNETGPTNIPLTSPGVAYFFCGVADHCLGGQKVAINVTNPTSSPPSPPPSLEPTPSPPLPETPPPATTPPALGPSGPAPTGSVIPPTPAATPPALGPGGLSPTSPVIIPSSATTPPPALGPGGPAPTGPVIPPPTSSVSPPSQGSLPPSSGGAVPPTSSPPSAATRTGLASIFTIFISAAVCLLF